MNITFLSTLVAVGWGLSGVFQKLLLKELNSRTVMIFSSSAYFMFLMVYLYCVRKEVIPNLSKINKKLVLYFLLNGLVGILLPNILYYYLSKKSNISLVTILTSTYPIWTLIFSYFILNEKLSKNVLFGIFLVTVGILWINKN